jgi:hypothetical protein
MMMVVVPAAVLNGKGAVYVSFSQLTYIRYAKPRYA